MCKCTESNGFQENLAKAKLLTEQTSQNHVVFALNGFSFMCKESELKDDFGICCYFLPDGTEVQYTSQEFINDIIINDAKIEIPENISKKRTKNLPKV